MKSAPRTFAADDAQPSKTGSADLLDDPRLMSAVQEYLQQLEAGKAPSRTEFLRRHAEVAVPLAQCLDGLDLVHQAAVRPSALVGYHAATAFPGPDGSLPANPLGDFQIVREIGHGGMGVVYEAIQLSLGRRVALKVLPLAATLDTKHLQRFRNEAQAAAALHHTNIVPVYAVGCERGVHFYAMQLIDGQTLAAVLQQIRIQEPKEPSRFSFGGQDLAGIVEEKSASCSESPTVGGLSETPSPLSLALSTHRSHDQEEYYRAVARFIVQAAAGLEHAHQFGIVHRDIKPANLLVDQHGRVWITDFGLAQFHADAGLTKTGDILGTLRYMSPEQASGQRMLLDHRTDVYSLGATLYQLATLVPMFPGKNPQELLNQILHHEPRTPRSVEARIPIELETIILKAVSKNPADRYNSAREFGADLERYLEEKPIQARRPGLWDRTRKWSRQHPSFIIAAVLLLVVGVVGFAVSTLIIAGAYGREKQRAQEAEQRFKLARRSADEMIRIAQEDLTDSPHMLEVRRRLLEAALTYYQEFIEQRREDPDAQAELAATRDLVKKILNDLVVLQGAGRHFLLKEATVRADLDLSEEQRAQVTRLFERLDRQRQDLYEKSQQMSPEDRQKRFLEMVHANETAIAGILNAVQINRLRQIAWQCQGHLAFHDSAVVAELKLTPEQKRQIRAIEANTFFQKPPLPSGDPSAASLRKAFEERRRTVLKQIRTVLTEAQTKRWSELIGTPFLSASQIFLPPGPQPPSSLMQPPPRDKS